MASNNELIEKIQEICEANSFDVPETKDLNNKDLTDLLSSLKTKDLIKSIQEAAEAKEVDVPETEGLTNKELAKILSGLKTDTGTPDAGAKAAAEANAKKKPPFTVVEGKSITCLKGSIDAGEEVKAKYLADGKKTLDSLIDRGLVVKN